MRAFEDSFQMSESASANPAYASINPAYALEVVETRWEILTPEGKWEIRPCWRADLKYEDGTVLARTRAHRSAATAKFQGSMLLKRYRAYLANQRETLDQARARAKADRKLRATVNRLIREIQRLPEAERLEVLAGATQVDG